MDRGEIRSPIMFLSSNKYNLSQFQQAALMLNTSRHVICNLDLKKEEEKMREICRRASTSDTGNLSSFQAVIRVICHHFS